MAPAAGEFTLATTEGASPSQDVALFTDATYPNNQASDFTSKIDWGDGATTTGTVSGPATTALDMYSQPGDWVGGGATYHYTLATGSFLVYNLPDDNGIVFQYHDAETDWTAILAAPAGAVLTAGTYDNVTNGPNRSQPQLEVVGDGRGNDSVTGSFTVKQAVYDAQGHVVSFDATFVQHGEGAPPALTGEIRYNASGGTFTVSGSHAYADDGVYTVTTTLTDKASGTATATTTAIENVASALSVAPTSATLAATEGKEVNGVLALINDPVTTEPASNFLATIDWGDGASTAGTVSGAAGNYSVVGSHTYADEGMYTVMITAQEADAPSSSATMSTFVASVADSDRLVGAAAAPIAATEGSVYTGTALATFQDSGYPDNDVGDFVASINWGDGTTAIGTISTANEGVFTVSSNHIYGDEGTYTVTVTLTDSAPGTAAATVTTTATVAEGDTLAAAPGMVVGATEGIAFNGAVATFTNGDGNNAPADFTSNIDWGDGTTSAGTVSEATTTSLDMQSQPGDSIGGGATYHYTTATGNFNVWHGPNDNMVAFSYNDPTNGWSVSLVAPNGTPLVPGTYDNAEKAGYEPGDLPGLDVAGDGRGSGTLTGSFTILQAVYDSTGAVLCFDATFVQHSNGNLPTLTGEIKYNVPTNVFTVSGTHTYADHGSYAVTATLADDPPGTAQATAAGTANVARALVLSTPNTTLTASEGAAFSGNVALLTVPGSNDPAAEYSAVIDWGDGTTSAGTVTGESGNYTVAGEHIYAEEGAYTITLVASEASSTPPTSASATLVMDVADSDAFVVSDIPISATEGVKFSGPVATFADPGYPGQVVGDFTASIKWGDGTTSAATATGGNGEFTINGSHTYADEGTYAVTVALSDKAPGTAVATVTTTATVADGDTLAAAPGMVVAATEGIAFYGPVATFTNGGGNNLPIDFNSSIDWGDGTTTAGWVSEGASTSLDMQSQPGDWIGGGATYHFTTATGNFSFENGPNYNSITFFYNDPQNNWSVTLAAPNGETLTPGTYDNAVRAAFRADDQPGLDVGGDGRGSNTLTGSFTVLQAAYGSDGAVLRFDATFVQHSEGGKPALTGEIKYNAFTNVFTVNGTHTYADEGSYPVSVSLFDDHPGTAAATATTTATVADNDTLTAGAPVTAAAAQDVMFSGALARFTDSTYAGNVPADFKAMIDWGDGATSVGTVTGAGGSFTVSGNHDYTKQGTMTATIVLADKAPGTAAGTAAGTATATINVADAPLHASGTTITATEATPITGPLNGIVATFTDADPNGIVTDYSATIDWGDGTTSTGAILPNPNVETDVIPIGGSLPITASGGSFMVRGSHTYAEDGRYTITVTIVDHGHTFTFVPLGSPTAADLSGSTATATSTAIVTEPALAVTALAVSGYERSPLASIAVATFKHGDGIEPASGFTATIDWGDGTVGPGIVTEVGTTYTVSGSHTYLDEGSFKVGVHVIDDAVSAGAAATATIKEELLPNGTEGTPNQRFIQEVYRDLFHRQVDPVGLDYWTKLLDRGESRWQVATAIISTAMPGELGVDLVTGMYQKYLGRSPDAADLAYWVGVVSGVGTIENTEAAIIGSQEFFALAGSTNEGFIERLFQVALGRNPTLEDSAYYLAGLLSRQSRQQVAGEILNSPEYYAREIAGYYQSPTDADGEATTAAPFIDDLDFLDRAADPSGLAAFTAAREHGTSDQQIWATMMASDEFFAKIA